MSRERIEEGRLLPAALIGATFLLVKEWIVTPPADTAQLAALACFAFSIPLYGFALFVTWLYTDDIHTVPAGPFFALPIALGGIATILGLSIALASVSPLVGVAFGVPIAVAAVVYFASSPDATRRRG